MNEVPIPTILDPGVEKIVNPNLIIQHTYLPWVIR